VRRAPAVAVVVLAWALAASLLAACGVRSDDEPRNLSAGQVPYGLLEDAPATTTSAPTPSVPKEPVIVFFVGPTDHLVAGSRDVNRPPTVAKALTSLLFGVQEDEAARGWRSAIDPTASIQARAAEPGTVTIDLSPEFAQGSASEQLLRIAQIVWTATSVPNVSSVRFTLDGAPIEAPTPTGSTADPVGQAAYLDFAPLPTTVSGTPS
jgi:spore germination protein GerM